MSNNPNSQILVFETNTMLNSNRKGHPYNLNMVGQIMDAMAGHKAFVVLPRAEDIGNKLLLIEDGLQWKENLLANSGLADDKEYRRKVDGSRARRVPAVDENCVLFQHAYIRGVEYYENLFSMVQTSNLPVNVEAVGSTEEMDEVCNRRKAQEGSFLVYRRNSAYYPQYQMLLDASNALEAKRVIWLEHPNEMLEYYRNTLRIYTEEYLDQKREYLKKISSAIAQDQPDAKFFIANHSPEVLVPLLDGEHTHNCIDSCLRLQDFSLPARENCELPQNEQVRKSFINDEKMVAPLHIQQQRISKRKMIVRVPVEVLLPKTKIERQGKSVMAGVPNKGLMLELLKFASSGGHVLVFPSCAILGARLGEEDPYISDPGKRKRYFKRHKPQQVNEDNFAAYYKKGKIFLTNILRKCSKKLGVDSPLLKSIESREDCNEFAQWLKKEIHSPNPKHSCVAVVKGQGGGFNETFIVTNLANCTGVRSVVNLNFPNGVADVDEFQKLSSEGNDSLRKMPAATTQKIAPLKKMSARLNECNVSLWVSPPFMSTLHKIRAANWTDSVNGAVRVLPDMSSR